MIKRNNLYGIACLLSVAGYVWIYLGYWYTSAHNISICPVKNLTGVPCPSCGTTRSVMSILHGNFMEGFLINPLGFIILIIASIFPVWILADMVFKKDSFYSFYSTAEAFLRRKWLAIPLVLLVLLNWIWNINKGL